jgi:hypothetical protein
MRAGGSTGQLVGQRETQVLDNVGHAWAELTEGQSEALLQEIFEDLIVEKYLVQVEGVLCVQVWAHR